MSGFAFWTAIWQGLSAGILCIGVFIAFRIVRFPDLSCDGTYPLGACVAGVLLLSGFNPFLATVVAMMCGVLAGCITGLLNTKLRIPAIVASILVMTALYSVNLVILKKPIISLSKVSSVFTGPEKLISDYKMFFDKYHITNIVYPIIFLIVIFIVWRIIVWFLNTEIGLALRASGDNPKMAESMGIDTEKMIWMGLGLANGLIALSGALFAQMQKFADVNLGIGMIIVGLASVFIGEAFENRLFRGSKIAGAITAVILGSLVYKFSIAWAYEIGLSTDYFNLLTSIIVAVALLVPSVRGEILSVVKRD